MAEKLQGLGFQSTLPRRERRKYSAWQCLYLQFQSTLPRRERRIDRTLNCVRLCYFNPRSREGSDYFFSASSTFCVISIHAPAKGATEVTPSIATLIAISIHAPAKGATVFLHPLFHQLLISIHAPAKGATQSS